MHPLYIAGFRKIGIFNYFLFPSTILKRDVETVSFRSSVRPSVCPSIQRESPLTATIFHQSLPNCYSLFIPMKSFIIFSFIKMWQKIVAVTNIFLFKLQYIFTNVCSLHEIMRASGCHIFILPSQRCNTAFVQLSKNSDQKCCMATFSLCTFLHLPSSITII